jgi:signal transduction histidine kinase
MEVAMPLTSRQRFESGLFRKTLAPGLQDIEEQTHMIRAAQSESCSAWNDAEATPDWKAIFESAPGAFLVLRPDAPRYSIIAVSDAYLRALRTTRDRVLGAPFLEMFPCSPVQSDAPGAWSLCESLERVILTGAADMMPAKKCERRPGLREGGERWWSSQNSPVFGEHGQLAYIIHRIEDISEFVRLERLREEWASIVAHDLLQPLNTISGYAQLLLRMTKGKDDHATTSKYVEYIWSGGDLLARMIADLLDASRLESRRMSLECCSINLNELVQETVRHLPDISERCVLRVKDNELLRVWADPGRVKQVLGNLLSNAAKYSHLGTPIGVAIAATQHGVQISVENHGPGIKKADLDRVFDRFERACKARGDGVSGLGLGLHIAKGLIEAQGGTIWAESTPGSVTAFHFTLPCEREVSSALSNSTIATRSARQP